MAVVEEADARRWRRQGIAIIVVALLFAVGVALVRAALSNPFDVSRPSPACRDSSVELIRLAAGGDLGGVEDALREGADPDVHDEPGNTPLACSGAGGEEDVVAALLEAGADPATVPRDGGTVLGDSVRLCRSGVVHLLLEAGVDPDHSGQGATPLDLAVERGSVDIARLLAAAGGTMDRAGSIELGSSREEEAACPPPDDDSIGDALAAVLQEGGDPDDVLVEAIDRGIDALVGPALAAGADPNVDTSSPGVGSFACALSGRGDDLRACDVASGLTVLVEGSASVGDDPAEADVAPVTPLLHAAWAGEVAAVQALLAAGADPNRPGPFGLVPLHAAAGGDREEVAALLLPVTALPVPGGVDPPSALATLGGHDDLAAVLLAAGA